MSDNDLPGLIRHVAEVADGRPTILPTTFVLEIAAIGKGELPCVTKTLPLAEAVHRALVFRVAGGSAVDCPELIGQDLIGQPLTGEHTHAKILPIDLNRDGYLDHVIVHATSGFGQEATRAIRSIQVLRWLGGIELAMRVVWREQTNRGLIRSLFPCRRGAKQWSSLTPFVPPRYLKKTGKNSLLGQIAAELASRGLLPFEDACVLDDVTGLMRRFERKRGHGRLWPPQDAGWGISLRFAQPVQGPLALGYASHFGLGLFAADIESD